MLCMYVCMLSTFSNIFSLETTGPIKIKVKFHLKPGMEDETAKPTEAKFHLYPPWDGGRNVCSNGPGHMTSMATIPIYGKTLKNLLLWNQKADDLESWYAASVTRVLPSLFKR